MDNTVLYGLSYGMYVVGADDGGRPVGCIINTCIQITSDNPMLAISLNKNNYTLAAIKKSGRFSLSIISEDTDPAIITAFGFQCSRNRDKYADFGYQTVSDVPVVNGIFAGRLICKVIDRIDCETHEVVLARLIDTVAGVPVRPMTYGYYHQVIKGKAPRNAPTYRPEENTPAPSAASQAAVQYVCPVCGYVHQGEIDDVPEGYVCPVCGFPGSEFEHRN